MCSAVQTIEVRDAVHTKQRGFAIDDELLGPEDVVESRGDFRAVTWDDVIGRLLDGSVTIGPSQAA